MTWIAIARWHGGRRGRPARQSAPPAQGPAEQERGAGQGFARLTSTMGDPAVRAALQTKYKQRMKNLPTSVSKGECVQSLGGLRESLLELRVTFPICLVINVSSQKQRGDAVTSNLNNKLSGRWWRRS